MNQKSRRRRTKRQAQRNKFIVFTILIVAMLIMAGSLYAYFSGSPMAATVLDYEPADIVYDRPIHAIHEMGESPPIPFLPGDQAQPAIAVSEESYDFGSIGPADVVERTFVIFNTGNAPLTISRAYTTCGCTMADITARSIPPGKAAAVTLTFDAGFHDAAGQTVRRGLIIENNDPRQSQAEIWIQASVRNS